MSNTKSKIRSILCILFSFIFIFGAVTFIRADAESRFDTYISTDKSHYGYQDTVKLSVRINNPYREELKDVKVIIESGDFGLLGSQSSEICIETVNPKRYNHADYSLILSRNFRGLGFFQRIVLFFKYLFSRSYTEIPKAGVPDGNYIKQTESISINGSQAEVTVYVIYDPPENDVISVEDPESGPVNINTTTTTKSSSDFTLKYDANGGNGEPSSQTGKGNVKVSSVIPKKDGYAFVGWSVNSNSDTPDYKPGATIALNKDTTLYAVWKDKNKVYKTPTGDKYHYLNPCGNGEYIECSLQEALDLGLEPCEKCVLK